MKSTQLIAATSLTLLCVLMAGCRRTPTADSAGSPEETYRAFVEAVDRNDKSAVHALMTEADANQLRLIDLLIDANTATRELNHAAGKAFKGSTPAAVVASVPFGDLDDLLGQLNKDTARKIDGDKASLSFADHPPLKFRKIDGHWKIEGASLLGVVVDGAAEQTLKDWTIACRQTKAEVAMGKFHSPEEASAAMGARVRVLLSATQPTTRP
jgi:hypothetical protein